MAYACIYYELNPVKKNKRIMKKIILKKNLIIPKGTIFENCDGEEHNYISGNYSAIIGTGKDGVISLFISDDVISDKPGTFEFNDKPEEDPEQD